MTALPDLQTFAEAVSSAGAGECAVYDVQQTLAVDGVESWRWSGRLTLDGGQWHEDGSVPLYVDYAPIGLRPDSYPFHPEGARPGRLDCQTALEYLRNVHQRTETVDNNGGEAHTPAGIFEFTVTGEGYDLRLRGRPPVACFWSAATDGTRRVRQRIGDVTTDWVLSDPSPCHGTIPEMPRSTSVAIGGDLVQDAISALNGPIDLCSITAVRSRFRGELVVTEWTLRPTGWRAVWGPDQRVPDFVVGQPGRWQLGFPDVRRVGDGVEFDAMGGEHVRAYRAMDELVVTVTDHRGAQTLQFGKDGLLTRVTTRKGMRTRIYDLSPFYRCRPSSPSSSPMPPRR